MKTRTSCAACAVVLVVLVCLAGCTELKSTSESRSKMASKTAAVESPPSFRERVRWATRLEEPVRATVIPYEAFLAMTRQTPPRSEVRAEAARIASMATSPGALGVFGHLEEGSYEGELFIVARDLRASPEFAGEHESADFTVVAMRASWEGPHITSPFMGFTGEPKALDCDPLRRGCHPVFGEDSSTGSPHILANPDEGGSGLSNQTVVNSESPLNVQNASGLAPELWLVRDRDEKSVPQPNRFVCFGDILSPGKCKIELPLQPEVVTKEPYRRDLDLSFTLIGEDDFKKLVADGKTKQFETNFISGKIVAEATVANAPEVVGVVASLEPEPTHIGGGPVVVARDLKRTRYGLEATSFYFPTIGIDAEVAIAGRAIKFGMSGSRNFTLTGPCGPVSISTLGVCDHPGCIPKEVPMEPMNPGYGTNRWPNKSRATIQVIDLRRPMRDTSIYACSEFRPPPVPHSCGSWWSQTETCNGEDDDCDGEIDEEGVCNACIY